MAVIKVRSLIGRATRILNDAASVRWLRVELQDWINDAYIEIVKVRPDANAKVADVLLAAGIRQNLADPASINLPGALQVLDVVRNTAATSKKKAIIVADRAVWDEQLPGWPSQTSSVNIENWMPNLLTPKLFMVYPPATAVARVELVYSSVPAQHGLSEAALDPNGSDATVINLDDTYAPALLDYVLYRAFLTDSEDASAQRATAHLAAFTDYLSQKTAVDVAVSGGAGRRG